MKLALDSMFSAPRRNISTKATPIALSVVLLVALAVPAAFAQCTLSGAATWTAGASGNWGTGTDWSTSPNYPNSSGLNVCITDGSSTVSLNVNTNIASLQMAGGNVLNFNPNTQLSLYGSQIINAGQININGGGNSNTYMYLNGGGTTTLSGAGTLALNTTTTGGGGNAYLYLQNGTTLVNSASTIQGEGIIYNNGSTITNQSGGTINANSSGSPLVNYLALQYGQVNNAGLLEATNSGNLQLYSLTVNNAGGAIQATGANAVVDLFAGTTVQGGTLKTVSGGTIETPAGYTATLDGSTGAGAVTINGTYTTQGNAQTYLHGTITGGNLQVNGGNNTNSYLYVPSNVTFNGSGTVTLQTGTSGGGGDAWLYMQKKATLDHYNTIQGEG
jgi:hypothetical protein